MAISRVARRPVGLSAGLGETRVAKPRPASLRGRQRRLGARRDQRALLLGQRRVDVQHERVHVRTKLCHNERNALRHQPGDERDIARQPIELGDNDRAYALASAVERGRQLRTPIERISALASLDLDILAGDLQTLGLSEALSVTRRPATPSRSPSPPIPRERFSRR